MSVQKSVGNWAHEHLPEHDHGACERLPNKSVAQGNRRSIGGDIRREPRSGKWRIQRWLLGEQSLAVLVLFSWLPQRSPLRFQEQLGELIQFVFGISINPV